MMYGNVWLWASLNTPACIRDTPVQYAYKLLEDPTLKVAGKYNFPISDSFIAQTGIRKDSFYFTQEIIRYGLMGSDTVHLSGGKFALKDVRALPTKKEEIVFREDWVQIILGHEKWVWLRNGLLFQIAGAGYLGLRTINGLAYNDPPFSKSNFKSLEVGAAVFLLGTLIHFHFNPYMHLGKKYRLECLSIPTDKYTKRLF